MESKHIIWKGKQAPTACSTQQACGVRGILMVKNDGAVVIAKRILAMFGVVAKKAKAADAKERLRLLSKPLKYKGGRTGMVETHEQTRRLDEGRNEARC